MEHSAALGTPSDAHRPWPLTPPQSGMLAFLASEVALFSTLIVTYLTYLGQDAASPTPREALSLPLVIAMTCCLLASSFTIHQAERHLRGAASGKFQCWWGVTIALGIAFLLGTAYEWHDLIVEHHLTMSRNLFGTTYYTLVGFHGLHVTCGVVVMLVLGALAVRGAVGTAHLTAVELTSWYWHFVDVVWIVVFLVVYVVGR